MWWFRVFLVMLMPLAACMPSSEQNAQSARGAVAYRDIEAVRMAVAARRGLEERDEIGDTPFLTAVGTAQFRIAEILIDGGCDIFAADKFGLTAGRSLEGSAIRPGTPEGDAYARVKSKMATLGFPFPAPSPETVRTMIAQGQWPQRTPPAPSN